MVSSKYLTMKWDKLITAARKALKDTDYEKLGQLDAVFHHRFFDQVRGGDSTSKKEFSKNLLRVTESPESRKIQKAEQLQQIICRWNHLDVLMDALVNDGDLIDEAERLIRSRAHAEELLTALAAESRGIIAGDLAIQLNISRQHLAILLRDMEPLDIIERRQVGRNVFVSIGLVGQLVAERREKAKPHLVKPSIKTESSFTQEQQSGRESVFSPLSRVNEALPSPCKLLAS